MRFTFKNFQKYVIWKKIQIIKHVILLSKNIGYNVLLMFFHIFYSFD